MVNQEASTRKEHDELTGRFLRILTKPLVKALVRTSIKPNQVTIISIIPALASIFFLVKGDKNTLVGALLAFLYIILDATDGQLAREKGLGSSFGKWLDGIIGFIFVPFMMLAAAIGLQSDTALLVGAVAALCFPIQFTLVYFFNSEFKKDEPRIELPALRKWQILRYSYGLALFFPFLLLGAILNKTIIVLFFFATVGHAFWMLLLLIQFFDLKKRGKKIGKKIGTQIISPKV
ncbi:MAG TPA: CDP-alcohol phosphatidyltransferase family protein [Candidatus Nanoarchaeia archaeon]|nr:CDP-alcohol phosphatidyltransferase family protein [Candidatus Nanoarchaeia archaeon]